jgi:hypothetical protein
VTHRPKTRRYAKKSTVKSLSPTSCLQVHTRRDTSDSKCSLEKETEENSQENDDINPGFHFHGTEVEKGVLTFNIVKEAREQAEDLLFVAVDSVVGGVHKMYHVFCTLSA